MNKIILLHILLYIHIVSSQFGPFSTQAPPFKFAQNPLSTPSSIWGQQVAPFETNSWYQNLALGDGYNPINLLPYIISRDGMTNGIAIGVPSQTKITSSTVVETPFNPSWYVSIKESKLSSPVFTSPEKMSVTLTMKYQNTTTEGSMTVPLVRGMGMFTSRFQKMTPKLTSTHLIQTITLQDGTELKPGTQFTASGSVVVSLDNGDFWAIYISDTTLKFMTSSNQIFALTMPANPLTLRLAYLTKDKSKKTIVDTYKQNIPSKVAVDYTINDDNTASITFTYSLLSLKDFSPINAGQVFMYALPHHIKTLKSPTTQDIKINTIKGQMTGVTDPVWTLTQTLTTTLWDSPGGYIDQTITEKLRQELRNDVGYKPTTNTHPYQFGTMVTKMARVAQIAKSLNETAAARIVAQNIIDALKQWLEDKNPNPLRFDATWGGLVTQASLKDVKAQYGSGVYNDHHFHYGYHVYAAAVAGEIFPDFISNYTQQLLSYVRDYANPSTQDKYFIVTRHKDWFCGHSWASGLVQYGENRNQESISEALHAYYAVALLGKSMKNDDMYNFGRLLLATEMTSAKTYWTITDPSAADAVYPNEFGGNTVVGVVWDLKAEYTTWFGGRTEYIHAIQMLPFTPITEQYLTKDYVTNEYKVLEKSRPDTTDVWYTYKLMDEAVIDTNTAYQKLLQARIQDWGGNSMSNALWWMATRAKPSQVQKSVEQ